MKPDRQKLRFWSQMVALALIAFILPQATAAASYPQKLWILLGVLALFFVSGIRLINENDRGVVFRLGRFTGVKTAGLK
jgi:regulator of protease activity HflC (stomatin/prohibitin superfamily)